MVAQETVIKKIDEIKYGLMSPQYIKKLATVEVITPELYDVDGYPIEKGLIDLSMGVVDPGLRCKTCYDDVKKCPGHFGHTTLAKPVLHPIFINELNSFLHVFCKFCGRATLPQNLIDKAKQRIEELKKHKNTDALIRFKKEVLTLAKKKAKCPHCEQKQPDIKLEKPYVFYEGGKRLWPNEIRERLEKIPDVDLPILGWDAKENRPEWMILTLLLIPPVSVRPSIVLISGERSEDDLTHKLSDIIRVNQRLVENLNGGAPQIIVEDLWDLLQYHVATFFDNTLPNIPVASHRSGRPLKTLAERLKGKEGRFRHNLAGKRVNFSARSVITPDPYISINELGVPQYVAMELTIPERVTEWNIDYLKALVEKGPELYPGANYVFDLDEKRLRITTQSKELILQSIQPGWIVERHLRDSDIVIFNRQPSLHRLSMMAHFVKLLPGRTFKISPFVTIPYNADFDGDEMNLHLPQTEEARAETQILMSVDKNIITPRYGSNIIGSNQDPILGIYILTKELSFTYKQAADLLFSAGLSIPQDFKNKSKISGKELFSTILPQDLDFEDEKYGVKIKKGKLIEGVINNSFIGQEGGSLTHQIYLKYGIQRVEQFINEVNKLGLEVANKNSYTMSFEDLDIPQKLKEDMKKRMEEATEKVQDVVKRFKRGQIKPLPGKTVEETKEVEVLQILNSVRTDIEKMIAKTLKEDRGIIKLIFSGTEGKILNLTQMIGLVGQNTLRGHRILHGYKDRTLPVFEKQDQGVEAGGFVKNGYGDGLSPTELFFNAVVGRDALMDTAMRTPNSGYLNRRLIYSMQDIKVHYDGTVRDANQNIIQFSFGGDNVDVSKSSSGKEKTQEKVQTKNENKPWLQADISEEIQLDPGETIGLVSAQSLSEPGTQLTMRTFHFVGVTELNVTLGLPRIIEIFDARKIPKTPLTHIYLKSPHNRSEEDAEKLAKKIEEVRLPKISDEISINFTDIKVIAKLNKDLLEKHSLTNEQIIASAKKSIKDAEIDIRGHILEVKIKESDVKRLFRIKYLMENLLVGGVKSITYVLPVKKENEYLLQCYGTNLRDILQLEEVDPTRTYSNDLYEVAENLGIEAARELIIKEVLLVLKEQGFEVDERHIALVSDLMTMSGRVKGVTRHGIITEKSSVLARASYEIPIKHLTDAAIVSESNEVNGVIDNVMINQPAPVGTALPGLAVKLKDELAHHVRKEKNKK